VSDNTARQTVELTGLLKALIVADGSDLCVKVGSRPVMRVHGELRWVDMTLPELTDADTLAMLHRVLPQSRMREFDAEHEVDFAYTLPDPSTRFRVNAFVSAGTSRWCSAWSPTRSARCGSSACPMSCAASQRRSAGSCS
jgi:Tfp pilus assembly ATPase PilU